jgi:hypothetical protein
VRTVFLLLFVYFLFLSSTAATATTAIITTAALTISNISVELSVPGSITAEGDIIGVNVIVVVAVGVCVGTTVG